ncbi:MAG: putative quinol monooxygenase [Myxococcota bacterium]|nr:putative quinol monooxygenase [Myxococcota bacterium]
MVIIQITHTILPEHVDLYVKATLANAKNTRQEPGNIRFDFLKDSSDPCTFQLYEVYLDQAAQREHLASAHFAAWKTAVDGVFAGRSITRFNGLHVPKS